MATIRLDKKNKTLKIVNRKDNIRLQHKKQDIDLEHSGKRGPKGDIAVVFQDEEPLVHEVLWVDTDDDTSVNSLGDLTYQQQFTVADTVTVNHNLGKYPSVSVIDTGDNEVIGDVVYNDNMTVTLLFSAPFSGRVTCN